MKKTLLLTLLTLLCMTATYAQNKALLLSETFDSSVMPEGWYIAGMGTENWSVSTSAKSGGVPNELCLNWEPEFYGTTRLVMPAFNLSGISSVVVSFKHYHDNYIGENKIGIATSSDNGMTWNSGWSEIYVDVQAFNESHTIVTSDMNKDNVLICIYFEGNSYLFNNWFFDNIEVFKQEDNDANLLSIDVPNIISQGELDVNFTVQNMGASTIESFDVECYIDNGETYTQTFMTNIAPFETAQYTLNEKTDIVSCEPFTITMGITSVNNTNDDDETNNYLDKDINVALGTSPRIVLIEHFTSSACTYPCIPTNETMNILTNNNPGEYSYVKYPIDIPSPGDPYCNEESMARKSYYAVSGVPQLFIDAFDQGYGPASQQSFDLAQQKPAYVNIRGSFTVENNTINIIADFMSYVDIQDVRAFVAVNEKVTTENIGNDVETEYHHILMKMVENAEGNEISINAGEYQRLEFSVDMSSTKVEDMNDLEVSLWIQDFTTKEVYNSHFAYEYTDHCYPVKNVTAQASDDAVQLLVEWEAPDNAAPIGYNIYFDRELVEENYTELIYSNEELHQELYDGADHVVEVVAVYENEMTSVGVATVVEEYTKVTELEDVMRCKVFPNPAKDFVTVSGKSIKSINIYNCIGILVDRFEVRNDKIEIDTDGYESGVYFINIQDNNGGNITNKLIIN